MSMLLSQKARDYGPSIYYDPDFRAVYDDHIEHILADASTTTMVVSPEEAYRYEYRPYLYLTSKKHPNWFHWYILRLNGINHPSEFTDSIRELRIPSIPVVRKLVETFNTRFPSV